jgi:hypothetical protein
MFGACERFGILPDAFPRLPRWEQVALLAYESLRRDERLGCPLLGAGAEE